MGAHEFWIRKQIVTCNDLSRAHKLEEYFATRIAKNTKEIKIFSELKDKALVESQSLLQKIIVAQKEFEKKEVSVENITEFRKSGWLKDSESFKRTLLHELSKAKKNYNNTLSNIAKLNEKIQKLQQEIADLIPKHIQVSQRIADLESSFALTAIL
jgi:hypothetical protein